jgi:hypothetical protein
MSFRIGAPHFIFGALVGVGVVSDQVPTEAKVALAAGSVFCQLLYQCWCKKPSIKEQLYTALGNRNWADLTRLVQKMPLSLVESEWEWLIYGVIRHNSQAVEAILQRVNPEILRSSAPELIRELALLTYDSDRPDTGFLPLINKLPHDIDPRIWFEKPNPFTSKTTLERIIQRVPQDQQAVIAETIYSKIPSDFLADSGISIRLLADLHIAILRKQEQTIIDCILQVEPQNLESHLETQILNSLVDDLCRILRNNSMMTQSVALALVKKMPASMCKRTMVQIVESIPQEQKIEVIDALFRKMPPEDLRSLGISLEFFQRLRSGEDVPEVEISQFIDSLDPTIWVARNGPYTRLGIAIALCSHIKKYEAIVLEAIKRLTNEEIQYCYEFFEENSGHSFPERLHPLNYAILCGANDVVMALQNRFPRLNLNPVGFHMILSTEENICNSYKYKNIGKVFSCEEYQRHAFILIQHLPLTSLHVSLYSAIEKNLNEIAKALVQRGVSYEVMPEEANWDEEISNVYKYIDTKSGNVVWNKAINLATISRQKFLELTTSGNIAQHIKSRSLGRK